MPFKIEKPIGVIGAGNMATAIVTSIVKKDLISPKKINIFDIDREKLLKLAEKTGVNISSSNKKVVETCPIIILAVKPNSYPSVLNEIKDSLNENHILISIAAGISIEYIRKKTQGQCKIVRVMPNTPALVGEGAIVVCKEHDLDEKQKRIVFEILSSLGMVQEVEEKYINAVTAISGSSPAYVYMFIEALADGGVMMGLSREQAYTLAAQAVLGAARMVLESQEHPGVLKDMVCSPGGTTIEAVYALEQKGFRGIIMEAVKKCAEKEKAMNKKGD